MEAYTAVRNMPEEIKALRPKILHIAEVVTYQYGIARQTHQLGFIHWFSEQDKEVAIQYYEPLLPAGIIFFDPPRIWDPQIRHDSDGQFVNVMWCQGVNCGKPMLSCANFEGPPLCDDCEHGRYREDEEE